MNENETDQIIELLKKAQEYKDLSIEPGDEMEMLYLGYLEKAEQLITNIQYELCNDN